MVIVQEYKNNMSTPYVYKAEGGPGGSHSTAHSPLLAQAHTRPKSIISLITTPFSFPQYSHRKCDAECILVIHVDAPGDGCL